MTSQFFDFINVGHSIYCFVKSKTPDVVSKVKVLKNRGINFNKMEIGAVDDSQVFILANQHPAANKDNPGYLSLSIINDIGDYDISYIRSTLLKGSFVQTNPIESLISLACSNASFMACITDYWGIMSHFWYHDENTFICSNNVFLVSNLINTKLSKSAMYEYLFFNAPLRGKTWFSNIKCLLPGQQLIFDIKNSKLTLSQSTDFSTLFEPSHNDICHTIEAFFLNALEKIESNTTKYIALSAGTDSRTILACLRRFDVNPTAISFGAKNMIETQLIDRLVNDLEVDWHFVNLKGFENNFISLLSKGTFISNGLLNPLRTHYLYFYDQIERKSSLFEGILGSEFVKGEINVGTMISKLHYDVIVRGSSIDSSINKHYSELHSEVRKNISNYIRTEYGSQLLQIETDEGLQCYRTFALDFIPSKIFAGIISLVVDKGISTYYPFLSPMILRSLFGNGYGISSSVSLRKHWKFVRRIECIEPESKIVQYMDNDIYHTILDRHISFKDALYPLPIAVLKKVFSYLRFKIGVNKRLKSGQIDNSRISEIIGDRCNKTDLRVLGLDHLKNVTDPLLTQAIVNLSSICSMPNRFA